MERLSIVFPGLFCSSLYHWSEWILTGMGLMSKLCLSMQKADFLHLYLRVPQNIIEVVHIQQLVGWSEWQNKNHFVQTTGQTFSKVLYLTSNFNVNEAKVNKAIVVVIALVKEYSSAANKVLILSALFTLHVKHSSMFYICIFGSQCRIFTLAVLWVADRIGWIVLYGIWEVCVFSFSGNWQPKLFKFYTAI